MQSVQLPAGSVHVPWAFGVVQSEQLFPETFRMMRLDFCLGAGPEKLFDAFVPEAPDHVYSV